jgi:membrane-bound serine protease (ClpP class)
MKSLVRRIVVVACVLLIGAAAMTAEPNEPNEPNDSNEDSQTVRAYVIPCKDLIDDGLFKSIQRRTNFALDRGAKYLIYEIGTYGGLLKSADDISKYLILDVGKKVRTVAYITTEAISAGAMISVSCQDIIMLENTTIGDCAPVTMGGELKGVEREKAESFTRAAFDRASGANGYPQTLLRAMVTMQIDVYRVENLETGEYEFFEGARMPKDPNVYDLDNKELIVKDDEILTLTSSRAHEYGIARAEVTDLAEAVKFLADRDGVIFEGQPQVLYTNWSEKMVRYLNHPAVMGMLVMIALLGVYVEFSTPGLGLPGLAAVICFAIIIGSKYLIGMANWVEVLVFVVGLLLLLVEIFVLPGFGIAGVLGITFVLAGLFGMLVKNTPDQVPWPRTSLDWEMFLYSILGLSIGFLGFLVAAWWLTRYLPKFEFLSGLMLIPASARQRTSVTVSMTAPAEVRASGVNVGDIGEVVSTLRPTGKAVFDGAIVDVVAEAEFLDKGATVEIIHIHGNRVVVKALSSQRQD